MSKCFFLVFICLIFHIRLSRLYPRPKKAVQFTLLLRFLLESFPFDILFGRDMELAPQVMETIFPIQDLSLSTNIRKARLVGRGGHSKV